MASGSSKLSGQHAKVNATYHNSTQNVIIRASREHRITCIENYIKKADIACRYNQNNNVFAAYHVPRPMKILGNHCQLFVFLCQSVITKCLALLPNILSKLVHFIPVFHAMSNTNTPDSTHVHLQYPIMCLLYIEIEHTCKCASVR